MSFFASSYLKELVTKRCNNVAFADQVELFFTVQNSINMSKLFNNQS